MTFWRWFFRGSGGRPGLFRFLDLWLVAHGAIGAALAWAVAAPLETAANAVLLPLAGIFVGLSFAWGGNAQALLQTAEIESVSEHHPGGFEEYVYTFQAAILCILAALTLWGIAGLGVFDHFGPTQLSPRRYGAVEVLLYAIASLAMRECWHVVLGAHALLLMRRKAARATGDS